MRHVLIALYALLCYSYAMNLPIDTGIGYTAADRAAMARLVAEATGPSDWLSKLTGEDD